MEKEIRQDIQKIKIPGTGRTMTAKTYSGKELFLRENDDERDAEYERLWEDDRL